ncbi:hypothetical protein NDU88_000424 [Pleurodeles waltl]|uniref:Uncharacterized protein n=1 Tax=Pleurodeles waltl TaxID=8319 RepID=A0AAV7N822_PLEWA|nr:hypothetical protein NDU88_000424 [Pleurodeles waltl]
MPRSELHAFLTAQRGTLCRAFQSRCLPLVAHGRTGRRPPHSQRVKLLCYSVRSPGSDADVGTVTSRLLKGGGLTSGASIVPPIGVTAEAAPAVRQALPASSSSSGATEPPQASDCHLPPPWALWRWHTLVKYSTVIKVETFPPIVPQESKGKHRCWSDSVPAGNTRFRPSRLLPSVKD